MPSAAWLIVWRWAISRRPVASALKVVGLEGIIAAVNRVLAAILMLMERGEIDRRAIDARFARGLHHRGTDEMAASGDVGQRFPSAFGDLIAAFHEQAGGIVVDAVGTEQRHEARNIKPVETIGIALGRGVDRRPYGERHVRAASLRRAVIGSGGRRAGRTQGRDSQEISLAEVHSFASGSLTPIGLRAGLPKAAQHGSRAN